jgi:peptide/nickel transport system permease protein
VETTVTAISRPARHAHRELQRWPIDAALRLARRQALGALSLSLILGMVVMAVFADVLAPYDPLTQNYNEVLKPPSWAHPLGTDNFGRDMLSRIIFGARISLGVGIASVAIGTLFGTALGMLSGYMGGKLDLVVQRMIDAWLAFPTLIFALVIVAALGPGLVQTIIAVGVVSIPTTTRVVRASVLAEKPRVYIEAARALGASHGRLMWLHILPNVAAPIIVIASLTLARAILTEASLSFLGVGVPPPEPAWGSMLSGQSRTYMVAAPWLAIWPGVAISLAVMSWNLFGDALRDVWDPRLRGN